MLGRGRRASLRLRLETHENARRQPLELEAIGCRWQHALDAADGAVKAAAATLGAAELSARRRRLASERQRTLATLVQMAAGERVRAAPWLSPVPVTPPMLGLPQATTACVFDLEGVLTDSGALHAQAWGEVLDGFLRRLAEQTDWHFIPFDRDGDYRVFVEGRPRLEGVEAFLDSRGISLRRGRVGDTGLDTAHGLARRKADALERGLRRRRVSALTGARRYLEAAGRARLERAVVSASASTLPMLELAGLTALVEQRIDADVIAAACLRSPPAPDVALEACRRLGVRPDEAVAFTHSTAGVAAAHAAGLAVVAVGDAYHSEALSGFGAARVVPSLSTLLDPRLAEREGALSRAS